MYINCINIANSNDSAATLYKLSVCTYACLHQLLHGGLIPCKYESNFSTIIVEN